MGPMVCQNMMGNYGKHEHPMISTFMFAIQFAIFIGDQFHLVLRDFAKVPSERCIDSHTTPSAKRVLRPTNL